MAEVNQQPYHSSKRKKKRLNSFVIVTETNLEKKSSQQFELNPETNEIYALKSKCRFCNREESGSTTSTTSTESTQFDKEWLSCKDKDALDNLVVEEPGHYRRTLRINEEISKRQFNNKVSILSGLRIQNTVRAIIDQRIQEALKKDHISVNVSAFLLMEDGSFRPYNLSPAGTSYELVRNRHQVHHIDRCQLFIDMIHHQEQFKQVLHIFHYLEHAEREKIYETKLSCLIYKREIEMIGDKLMDEMDIWNRIGALFEPKLEGYYYAIIVCFDLFKEGNK